MEPDSGAESLQQGMSSVPGSQAKPTTFQRLRRAVSMLPADQSDGPSMKRGATASQPANGVFPDPDSVKEAVRDFLEQKKYNVQDYYKDAGIFQRIARSNLFDHVTLFMIVFNAFWIMVDTDYNDVDLLIHARAEFLIMENVFCVYFTAELFIRYCSFRRSWDAFRDLWFLFDAVIVMFMIFETWIITLLVATLDGLMLQNSPILGLVRLLRLFRMTRVVRVLKAFPEIMILLKGMIAAFRSVIVTLGLLLIVTYVYAIAFTSLSKEYNFATYYFPDVPASMFTCIVRGALLDEVSALLDDVGRESGMIVALFLTYVLIAAVTVMNLLIGVLCEVVTLVASAEREELLIGFVQGQLEKIVATVDLDGNGLISHKEMKAILQDKDAVRALHSVGVDPVSLVDLADVLFPLSKDTDDGEESRSEMTFVQFMQELLELRGKNTATVKDMITLRKVMKVQQEDLLEAIGKLESSVLSAGGNKQSGRSQGDWTKSEPSDMPQLNLGPTQSKLVEGKVLEEELSRRMLELRQILDATLASSILRTRSSDALTHQRDQDGFLRIAAIAREDSPRAKDARSEDAGGKLGRQNDLVVEDLPGMQELAALERVLSHRHLQDVKDRPMLPGSPVEEHFRKR
mmetsp:Transcript_64246/g.150872  ORF Transcript_64246/g.150872 Transcript_64246/m.150872 type:complete len:630 (+) Transcript_64246:66-1955(+)